MVTKSPARDGSLAVLQLAGAPRDDDASIFCIDLIDESRSNSCNEKCHEDVCVESCDDLIAKENDEFK